MTDTRQEQYRRFVEARAPRADEDGYLFDTPRCRFEPEPGDELVAAPGTRVVAAPGGVNVEVPGGGVLLLHGLPLELVQRAFRALPCSYSRLNIELGGDCPSFIEQAFSKVVFAPAAVAELEAELSSVELVRFPGSPYEVVRAYWRNCCAVRRHLEGAGEPQSVAQLRALLLELHELLLLGEGTGQSRSSFYLPASLLGRKRPQPGSFYEVPTGIERRGTETILSSGARVSVPLLGGVHYWQLLGESLSDTGLLDEERQITVGGLDLGQVVRGRAETEEQARPWFLPPRPLTDAHFAALLADLTSAGAAERARDLPSALQALASFHYRFVRIHPLPSGNQSLSMSFVNHALGRLLGLGMPHLLLDQMALRLELPAYRSLFVRLVRTWCAPWPNAAAGPAANKAQRLRHLLRMRHELNDFVASLGNAPTLLEARGLLAVLSEAAALAGFDGADGVTGV
ncbi:MAG TPA: hypothetical protein VHB79_22640 [Polyangiaceae bacterium]|nr:hypothetical protein [Polyangiaceae bacterium]